MKLPAQPAHLRDMFDVPFSIDCHHAPLALDVDRGQFHGSELSPRGDQFPCFGVKRSHGSEPPGRLARQHNNAVECRIRDWRARHGPDREVIFRQTHNPDRLGQRISQSAKK